MRNQATLFGICCGGQSSSGTGFSQETLVSLSVSSYYALDKEVKSMLKCKNWRR